ncbi:MAG: protease SohB, partial [Gammaproteobacteria bacterium]
KKEKAAAKAARKADKTHKAHKAQQDTAQSDQPDTPSEHTDVSSDQKKRLFVIDFHGDIKASAVNDLARCVTAILTIAEANRDEVLVRLESPGGLVHAYGLAAAQLQRIRDRGVSLTVAVDRVAASGGYMMAVVANTIVAAPFAVIGSIGVVAQIPNFHRVLQKHEVDLELHTAGEYKRTLTLFGHNTEEGRQKFITELEATHRLFKEHIDAFRPGLDLAKVATGEHWYGKQAHKLNLIDEIMTSDDYVLNAAKTAEILEIEFETRKTVAEKLSSVMGHVASRVLSEKWFGRGETGSTVSSLSREHEWVRAQLQDSNVPVGAIHGMCDEVRDALK